MEIKNVFFFIVLEGITDFAAFAAKEEPSSRTAYFTTRENKRLLGHVVKQVKRQSLMSCSQLCLRNGWCTSTNFIMSSKKDDKGTCELNQHDISLINEDNEFHQQEGIIFSVPLKDCLMTGCLNGGLCLSYDKKQKFSCLCTLPWTGERCQVKNDIDDCASHPCKNNGTCTDQVNGFNCSCAPGFNGTQCQTASPVTSVSSCKELYDKHKLRNSQVVPLKFSEQMIPVYCHVGDFGCGDGGWTLAMKIDGSKRTFHYNSHFWNDKKGYNLTAGQTGFDTQETKLPTYWNTSFSKICLGIRIGQKINFIVINETANSLYSLIADGQYRATSLGRDTWKKLIGSQASLQRHCNKEGFNAVGSSKSHAKARIGIITNGNNQCDNCNSRIGFGTGGDDDDNNTCGNEATHTPDNEIKHIKAMGYILVQ